MNDETTKKQISALIGRSLSSAENENFGLYYDLAKEKLNSLLGGEAFVSFDKAEAGMKLLFAKMFDFNSSARSGESKIESKSVDGYSVRYNQSANSLDYFLKQNSELILRYKIVNRAKMRNGKTIYDDF